MNLYNKIAVKSQMPTFTAETSPVELDKVAEDLLFHQGKGLVVSGTNDIYIQAVVNAINFLLANLGGTFHFERTLQTKKGCDHKVDKLIAEMTEGSVGALILNHVNPAYDYPEVQKFLDGLSKVELTISLGEVNDETTKLAKYACPDHHYLESWNDAEPYSGMYSFQQPTIHPIFNTRQSQDSLLKWAGAETDYHNYIKKYWEENLFGEQDKYVTFTSFWNNTLQEGIFVKEVEEAESPLYDFEFLGKNAGKLKAEKPEGVELIVYEKIGIGNGQYANNPWLQELPDPISKAVWDNYIALSPQYAKEIGVTQEDMVSINNTLELPVMYQPGQPYGTASIAMGYGRIDGGKVANGIGKNVFSFATLVNDTKQYNKSFISIEKTGETYPLATTQTYHSMEGRPIVRETVLDKWKENPDAGNELHEINEQKAVSLYTKPEYEGFHWALGVDLNKCTGCSACVIACQAENNIAVIGKEEVKKQFYSMATQFGVSRKKNNSAIDIAYDAWYEFQNELRQAGEDAVQKILDKNEKAIVLLGRPYNLYDKIVNLNIPNKLRQNYGVNVIPLDFLDVDSIDIKDINDNMYWNYGQKIIKTARWTSQFENFHLIYITNFKCGPDSYIKHYIRDAAQKPYLTIQFDEHGNDAGIITRCEAYLDSKGFLR